MDLRNLHFDECNIELDSDVFNPALSYSILNARDPFYNLTEEEIINDEFQDWSVTSGESLDEDQEQLNEEYFGEDEFAYEHVNEDVHMGNVDEENGPHAQPVDLFYNYAAFSDHSMFDRAATSTSQHASRGITHATLKVGMSFMNKQELAHMVRQFSLLNRVKFYIPKSSPYRWKALCKYHKKTGCEWRCRATCGATGIWTITKLGADHSCFSLTSVDESRNRHLNVETIALHMRDKIKARLDFSPNQIREDMKTLYQYSATYNLAWKGRLRALEMLFGDYIISFDLLPRYLHVLQLTNPGTIVHLQKRSGQYGEQIVERLFWAFGPCIEGFQFCKPVITVDGTHLYGKYKGVLLVAVASDAEHHLLPVAFAIVDCENTDNWDWFLSCIRERVTFGANTCIISDRHIGIINAMNKPTAKGNELHMFCSRHVCSNFNSKVKNTDLKEFLALIAGTCKKTKFWILYRQLLSSLDDRDNGQSIGNWLESKLDKSKWALAFDNEGKRWGSMTSNAAECFNSILLGGRDLPITAIVQFSFSRVNKWFIRNRRIVDSVSASKLFVPYVEDKILSKASHAATHSAKAFDEQMGKYQVTTRVHQNEKRGKWKLGKGGNKLWVSLSDRECSCGKWTAFHYPCSHVMAVCRKRRESYANYIDPRFTMEAYRNTWAARFNPIPDVDEWPQFDFPKHVPDPIYIRSDKGRPKITRFHNEMDRGIQRDSQSGASTSQIPQPNLPDIPIKAARVMTCKTCGGKGHNKRGCPIRNN